MNVHPARIIAKPVAAWNMGDFESKHRFHGRGCPIPDRGAGRIYVCCSITGATGFPESNRWATNPMLKQWAHTPDHQRSCRTTSWRRGNISCRVTRVVDPSLRLSGFPTVRVCCQQGVLAHCFSLGFAVTERPSIHARIRAGVCRIEIGSPARQFIELRSIAGHGSLRYVQNGCWGSHRTPRGFCFGSPVFQHRMGQPVTPTISTHWLSVTFQALVGLWQAARS